MRMIKGLVAGLVLGISSAAVASEPLKLDAAQLDSVSAGVFSGIASGFTSDGFGVGNSISFFEFSQAATLSQTELTPGAFQSDFQAAAASTFRIQSAGAGLTSSGGVGGVYTTVFLNP